MKYGLLGLVVFVLFFLNVSAQQKKEAFLFSYFMGNGEDGLHLAYSHDGLKWKALKNNASFLRPKVGEDKLMRDPCIIDGPDGKFHMVWTVSWKEKGIGYAWSEDLINWSEQKYIPVMEHEETARNCWAPEVFYDDATKQFLIFWSTIIPGRFPENENMGDTGYNHRMYYTLTKSFEDFSDTKLFYDRGFNVIDGTLAKQDNPYLLFLKDETLSPPQKNIRLAKSNSLTGEYSEPSHPITGDYWAEGPTALKINGAWVVYFDKYRKNKMGAVRSQDLKNWEDISDQISFPENARHGTIFTIPAELLEKLKNID